MFEKYEKLTWRLVNWVFKNYNSILQEGIITGGIAAASGIPSYLFRRFSNDIDVVVERLPNNDSAHIVNLGNGLKVYLIRERGNVDYVVRFLSTFIGTINIPVKIIHPNLLFGYKLSNIENYNSRGREVIKDAYDIVANIELRRKLTEVQIPNELKTMMYVLARLKDIAERTLIIRVFPKYVVEFCINHGRITDHTIAFMMIIYLERPGFLEKIRRVIRKNFGNIPSMSKDIFRFLSEILMEDHVRKVVTSYLKNIEEGRKTLISILRQ